MNNSSAEQLFSLFKQGRISAAGLAAVTPTELTALYAFGLNKLEAGQYRLAATLLRGLTALNGNNAAYWAALGLAESQLGRSEQAREAYDRALELDNNLSYVYLYRAELFIFNKDFSNARADLERVTNLDRRLPLRPDFKNLLQQLNNFLTQHERPTAAATVRPAQSTTGCTTTGPNATIAGPLKQPVKIPPLLQPTAMDHTAKTPTGISDKQPAAQDVERTLTAIIRPLLPENATLEQEREITRTAIVNRRRDHRARQQAVAPPPADPEITHTAIVNRREVRK